jgi:S-adenosylmethionine:tRNA ribosyltransferase-isomerase
MHPKNTSIAGFGYDLPQDRIAHRPLAERDQSKLLIYRGDSICEDIYRNIAHYIPENSLLVFNNTKVVEARILFQKDSGAQIEVFCLEPSPEYGSIATALAQTGSVRWKCLIGGASKWKPGQTLRKEIREERSHLEGIVARPEKIGERNSLVLEARWAGKSEGCFLIELSWSPPELSFAELLHQAGLIPLPPYIRRNTEEADSDRYQTVYARHDGSVAAPTAGLHFTHAIFNSLGRRLIDHLFVTLHVGAGTFMPVKSDTLEEHTMHSEYILVEQETIKKLLESSGRVIIPVGTTSLRTIESLYWLGVKTITHPGILPGDLVVGQWDPYGPADPFTVPEALLALLEWMERRGLTQLFTKTQLLITPGYDWKLTTALITNFHQPGSTLLLLVAALIGEDWKKVYRHALDHGFRFLSYGDGCLLFPRAGDPGQVESRKLPLPSSDDFTDPLVG